MLQYDTRRGKKWIALNQVKGIHEQPVLGNPSVGVIICLDGDRIQTTNNAEDLVEEYRERLIEHDSYVHKFGLT